MVAIMVTQKLFPHTVFPKFRAAVYFMFHVMGYGGDAAFAKTYK